MNRTAFFKQVIGQRWRFVEAKKKKKSLNKAILSTMRLTYFAGNLIRYKLNNNNKKKDNKVSPVWIPMSFASGMSSEA